MKRFYAVAIAVFLSIGFNAHADERMEICADKQDVAARIMAHRQNGWPIEDIYGIANGNQHTINLADEAWSFPIENNRESKVDSVVNFANNELNKCVANLSI